MDTKSLKSYALSLKVILDKYAKIDEEAGYLRNSLSDIIMLALAERITQPIDLPDIPGGYFFNEGNLRKYPDLERAYSEFAVEASGGIPSELQKILDEASKNIKKNKNSH